MTVLLTAALLAGVALSRASAQGKNECKVQAWVRAEDLRPDHISHGELRIRVPHPEKCSSPIESVSLRLQLDEFSEVKHLRRGAVLPEIRQSDNQSIPSEYLEYYGTSFDQAVYDFEEYDRAMSDPTFWVVKAEERRAWSTAAILFGNNTDFSLAKISPFIVAAPAVNYPPSSSVLRSPSTEPIRRHAFSKLAYNYIAVVKFDDGQTLDVAAGHTNFVPVSTAPLEKKAFTWNTTFVEQSTGCEDLELPDARDRSAVEKKCLPEQLRSVFVAEVKLDEGNVVQRGQLLKGKVTVHATNGSTTMSDMSATFRTHDKQHWAVEQAAIAGDEKFTNDSCPRRSLVFGVISADSSEYLFQGKNARYSFVDHFPAIHGPITPATPSFDFDFELEISKVAAPTFASHYSSTEAELVLELTVLYSHDAAVCIIGVDEAKRRYANVEDEQMSQDDAVMTEEGMWDSHTPVGDKVQPEVRAWYRSLRLTATVPLVVLGDISAQPVEHYLKPGLPSPVLLAAEGDVVFPLAQPEIIEESLVDTSARLMQSDGTFDPFVNRRQFMNMTRLFQVGRSQVPDPTGKYNQGNYAGLLWKKKVVAEERGLLPATELADGESTQYRFLTTP